MSDRLRAVTFVLGATAALLALLLATAGPLEAAKPATKSCSVAGLRYVKKAEGVTYSVAVANLKAKVAPCPKARTLAGTVAKDILDEIKVPARISGFTVTVKEACAGCTPNTSVTARSGQELITFTVKGGA